MNKKILTVAVALLAAATAIAGPGHFRDDRRHHGHGRPAPVVVHHHHHGGGYHFGHAGRNFWPGFVGGVVGGIVGNVVAPREVVVVPEYNSTTYVPAQPVYVAPAPAAYVAPAPVVEHVAPGYHTTTTYTSVSGYNYTRSGYTATTTVVAPAARTWVCGHYENGVYIPGHYIQ